MFQGNKKHRINFLREMHHTTSQYHGNTGAYEYIQYIPCGSRSAIVSQSVHSSFMCGEHLYALSQPGRRTYHTLVVTVTPGPFHDQMCAFWILSSSFLNTSPLWFLRNHPFTFCLIMGVTWTLLLVCLKH